MAATTISVSKEFQNWLKSKGLKGESYEEIIQKLIKPEMLEEYKASKPYAKPQTRNDIKETKESDIVDEMFERKLT